MSKGDKNSLKRGLVSSLFTLIALISVGCHYDDPTELERAARVNFANGRLGEAEETLARLARIRPLTVSERVLRAQVAHDQGRLDDAIRALDDPREPKPVKHSDAALLSAWRGWLEMQRHHLRAAEDYLSQALAVEPGRVQARHQLIDLYTLQGRTAQLTEQARMLAKSASLDFTHLYVWTIGQREGLDPAELARVLEDAVQADPGDHASRLALAECLRKQGQLDQARALLKNSNLAQPEIRAVAARIAMDQGDLKSVDVLLTGEPGKQNHPALSLLRGQLALLRDDPKAARKQFEEALRLAPENRDAQFGLGQALCLLDQARVAAPHLRAARDYDHLQWLVQSARPPTKRKDPVVLREIGAACLALGRRDQAHAWLKLALSYSPEDRQLQNMLAQITPES